MNSALGYQIFRWVKYLTYALLSLNIWLFLAEEIGSARFAIATGEEVAMGIQLFSATLDTLAWVILLLLFELETAVIPDERLRGPLRYGIHGVRMLCMLAIVMAFLGYFGEWLTLLPSELLMGDACVRVSEGWSYMVKLDDFVPLTAENCSQFGADTRLVSGLDSVIASPAGLLEGQRLALVDVINSAAWILVVILLEIEVRLLTRWGGGFPADGQCGQRLENNPLRHTGGGRRLLGLQGRLFGFLGRCTMAICIRLHRTQCVRVAAGNP
jgi:hypothetical protein